MPKPPVIEDADRDLLDELVGYYEVRGSSAPLSEQAKACSVWDECVEAGFVTIDNDMVKPTPEGITYIRRSRGHRGKKRAKHATEKQRTSPDAKRADQRSAESDPREPG